MVVRFGGEETETLFPSLFVLGIGARMFGGGVDEFWWIGCKFFGELLGGAGKLVGDSANGV